MRTLPRRSRSTRTSGQWSSGLIEEWLAKFGESLPTQMQDELATLKANLGQ